MLVNLFQDSFTMEHQNEILEPTIQTQSNIIYQYILNLA
jgi:hypothetical protein